MNQTLLDIYYALPYWMRSVAATARGAYLHHWRYDGKTERLVEEAFEREYWSDSQWKEWQQKRLDYVLNRAATQVPYYRAYWSKRRPARGVLPWQRVENWEVLEKDCVRANPQAFVASDMRTWRMFPEHTSGTTGKPLVCWRSREMQRAWYALLEARIRRWYGVSLHDRWAIFGGQLIVPVSRKTAPFWVWNAALNQLYLSSFHLAPDFIPHYLDALRRYRITYLLGYTSALYSVAQHVLKLGRRDLKMSVVVTNAEPVSNLQRRVISEAFQCAVRETYGTAETVVAASECSHGAMHLWPEVGSVEVLDGQKAMENGETGDLVCTGLINADMPLIRYRLGDRGALLADRTMPRCGCGRTLPRLASLEGRVDDILYTEDGRQVGRLDPVFKGSMPVEEAQIIQESLKRIRIRYVPTREFGTPSGEELVRAVRAHLGNVDVILEPVDCIPREPNGKFRAVVCALPTRKAEAPRGSSGVVESVTKAG